MKSLALSIAGVLIIGAIFVLTKDKSDDFYNTDPSEYNPISLNNVSITDGKQIIEITARGGFSPRKSVAKAGIPTILRFNTNGTFDCSSSIRIPSMNISKSLPSSGVTDIDLGSPPIKNLKGSCGMGMYPFEIEFQS